MQPSIVSAQRVRETGTQKNHEQEEEKKAPPRIQNVGMSDADEHQPSEGENSGTNHSLGYESPLIGNNFQGGFSETHQKQIEADAKWSRIREHINERAGQNMNLVYKQKQKLRGMKQVAEQNSESDSWAQIS